MTAVMEPETEIAERPVGELLGNGVESGSVVEVSGDAGPTQGWLVVEDGSPTGERRCAVVPLDGAGSVLSGSMWEVKVKPSAAAGVMPQWVSAVAAGWWACRVAIKERDTAQRELRMIDTGIMTGADIVASVLPYVPRTGSRAGRCRLSTVADSARTPIRGATERTDGRAPARHIATA